ncbi:MAG: GAF domain-containing protein, partial [Candidatus Omnitrophica bacterium]|nr:GAF domain-containing protein [Candidatus Omnitrophota bacterium]
MEIKKFFSFKKQYLVIVKSVIFGFCLLILLTWMNEILDLPFYLFGGQKTILNWQEMLIETILLLIVAFITLKSMFNQFLVCNSMEDKLERFNKVLLLITQINQDILWIKSKQQLCDLICSGFVKYDYKFVWIGFCDEETKRIVPQSQAGFEDGYLEEINITHGQDKSNLAPEVMAVKLKRSSVMRFIAKGTDYSSWSKQALSRGYMSLAAVPIFIKDKVIGVLNFYSGKEDAFDDKE